MAVAKTKCHVVRKMGYSNFFVDKIHLLNTMTAELSAIQEAMYTAGWNAALGAGAGISASGLTTGSIGWEASRGESTEDRAFSSVMASTVMVLCVEGRKADGTGYRRSPAGVVGEGA